jgi:hypothetical protein
MQVAARGEMSLCAATVQRLARYARVDTRTMRRWLAGEGKTTGRNTGGRCCAGCSAKDAEILALRERLAAFEHAAAELNRVQSRKD